MENGHTYEFISSTKYRTGEVFTIDSIDHKPHLNFIKKKEIFFKKNISICEDDSCVYIAGQKKNMNNIFVACFSKKDNNVTNWMLSADIILSNEKINITAKNKSIYLSGNIINEFDKRNEHIAKDFNGNKIISKQQGDKTFICCIENGTQKWFKMLNNCYTNSFLACDDISIYFSGFSKNYIFIKKLYMNGSIEWNKKTGPFVDSKIKITISNKYIYLGGQVFLKSGVDNNYIFGFNNESIVVKEAPFQFNDLYSFIFAGCLTKQGNGWVRMAGNSGCSNMATDICCFEQNFYLTGVVQNSGSNYTTDFNNKIVNLKSNINKTSSFKPYDIFVAKLTAKLNIKEEWMVICGGDDNDGVEYRFNNIYPKISCFYDTIYVTGFITHPVSNKIYDFSNNLFKLKSNKPLIKEAFVSCLHKNGDQEWFKTCYSNNDNLNAGIFINAVHDKVYLTGILTSSIGDIIDFSGNNFNLTKKDNTIYTFMACLHKNKNKIDNWFLINETNDIVLSISHQPNKDIFFRGGGDKIYIVGYLNDKINLLYIACIKHLTRQTYVGGIVTKCEFNGYKIKQPHIPHLFRDLEEEQYKTTIVCNEKIKLNKCNFRKGQSCFYNKKEKKIMDIKIMHCSDYIYLGKVIDNKIIKLDFGSEYRTIEQELIPHCIYYWDNVNNKYVINGLNDPVGVSINKHTLLLF